MRRTLAALAVACTLISPLAAPADAGQPSSGLERYLPEGIDYDPAVPKPAEVLGFEVGEWHVRHDQLVSYLEALAASSNRVTIEETGKTHEARPLLVSTFTSPSNHGRLDEIEERHAQLSEPTAPRPDVSDMPVVVYLAYSVHGNEASGSNAALVVAYHLAAARGPEVEELLESSVILLDPSLNPDGLARFAHWANMHRGRVLVDDPAHREHREGWPSGRTNHYFFDLNRDWILAQHPETRARLATYQGWRPNVLTDHHEMGTDATFFFQPGIPSRKNPLTPDRNVELTEAIAAANARALDRHGRLYFTEEIFDDFYYGKGSTYPDVQGTIGILFEQASARGHLQASDHGPLSFPFAIENQVIVSLSTLDAALERREELLEYQADFFREALEEARAGELGGYVFGDGGDRARAAQLVEILLQHGIEVRELERTITLDDERFEPGRAWAVLLDQRQARLVRALFERRTEFEDSTFYDVSTWTLPLAFGLPAAELGRRSLDAGAFTAPIERAPLAVGRPPSTGEGSYAHLLSWEGYFAPRALQRLLGAGVRAYVATRGFEAETAEGRKSFPQGTVVVPAGGRQPVRGEALHRVLSQATLEDGVEIETVTTGLTPAGIDLGSPSLEVLAAPRPALLVGGGVSSYEAGEVWHLLDHRFEIPLTLLEKDHLPRVDLERYSHLILVDGGYGDLGEEVVGELQRWVRRGGVLITTKRAAVWAEGAILGLDGEAPQIDDAQPPNGRKSDFVEGDRFPETGEPAVDERRPYGEARTDRAKQLVSGAIFETELDLTHPLAFGYRQPRLPVFRNSTLLLRSAENPYRTVARYSGEPLLSGYVSPENLEKLRNQPSVIAQRMGAGLVVRMVDNPNFRGFWYGTNRLFLNALFFGSAVESTPDRGE